MNIYYKIIKVNEDDHNIEVRYYTDYMTEKKLATSIDSYGEIIVDKHGSPARCSTDFVISFYDNPNPTVDEIKNSIEKSAPVDWFKLKENVKANNIYSLKNAIDIENVVYNFDAKASADNDTANNAAAIYLEVYNLFQNSEVIHNLIKKYVYEKILADK